MIPLIGDLETDRSGAKRIELCHAAMAALMADSGLQKRLGEAGRHEVIERFSADHMVANTLAVYEELAGTNSSALRST